MTRTVLTIMSLAVAGSLAVTPSPAAGQATDWRQIQKPPLRPFTPEQPRRVVFPNGMVVLLQVDRELPLVNGFARIRGGSREEPAEKAGLVSIYGQVWRTGGTKARTGDQLDDFLEARAATVETGGDLDSTTVSLLSDIGAPVVKSLAAATDLPLDAPPTVGLHAGITPLVRAGRLRSADRRGPAPARPSP